jgi:hypothetical protein
MPPARKATQPSSFEYEYRFRGFDAAAVLRAARRLGAEAPERSLLINTAFAASSSPDLHVRLRDVVPTGDEGRRRVTVLTVKRLGGAFDIEHETGVTAALSTSSTKPASRTPRRRTLCWPSLAARASTP